MRKEGTCERKVMREKRGSLGVWKRGGMREKVRCEVGARNVLQQTPMTSITKKAIEKLIFLFFYQVELLSYSRFLWRSLVFCPGQILHGGERERKQGKEPSLSLTSPISPLSPLTFLFLFPLSFLVHISVGILARRSSIWFFTLPLL